MPHFILLIVCTYRLSLSALHYNENGGRAQGKRKDGQLMWVVRFPKFKHGLPVLAKVYAEPTFGKGLKYL